MYLCQVDSKDNLSQIQKSFNLRSIGTVSCILTLVRRELKKGNYKMELGEIRDSYII